MFRHQNFDIIGHQLELAKRQQNMYANPDMQNWGGWAQMNVQALCNDPYYGLGAMVSSALSQREANLAHWEEMTDMISSLPHPIPAPAVETRKSLWPWRK